MKLNTETISEKLQNPKINCELNNTSLSLQRERKTKLRGRKEKEKLNISHTPTT